MKQPKYLRDCELLSRSKLRSKYKAEANSHRAMLSRRKQLGAVVAVELVEFRNFLRLMGPRPAPGHTVDRLNSNDPEYTVSKIAWRSKKDQSRNRRNVIVLKDTDGTSLPLTEWAERTHQSRHTLHSRKKRGFTDAEVIHGPSQESFRQAHTYAPRQFPWPGSKKETWQYWETQYRTMAWAYPGFGRPESRVAFLVRRLADVNRSLMEEAERSVNPNVEPGPEHDELFRKLDVCARELRKAVLLRKSV